jgi:hypothetical protein
MITINCTKCARILELDDAFAGGVCRCGTCGAIQHVPRELRPASAAPVNVSAGASKDSTLEYASPAPASSKNLLTIGVAGIVLLVAAAIIALFLLG